MLRSARHATASDSLRAIWRNRGWQAWSLRPLAGIYGALRNVPPMLYRHGIKHAQHAGVPTIVIGNVIAGGAGKTPITQATVAYLKACGLRPGIISRGYGRSTNDCRQVLPDALPQAVGDEPLLMARTTSVPVFVARQRIDAARALLAYAPNTDVLVCDDGLQHHALARDLEICVFNDEGIGNGWLLPAGPLREPWPRAVDAVLHTACTPPIGTPTATPCFHVQRQLAAYALRSDGQRVPLDNLRGRPLHALAAIARPEDFFTMLRQQSLTLVRTQALPDHYGFTDHQKFCDNDLTIVCTEKDAAKLWQIRPDALAIALTLNIDAGYFDLLAQRLGQLGLPANLIAFSSSKS